MKRLPGPPFADVSNALEAAGLWDDLDLDERNRKKADVAAGGWPLDSGAEGSNWWFADGEELAEGGIEEWLRSMADALQAEGVVLFVSTVHAPASSVGYTVEVNGTPIEIYSSEGFTATAWEDATLRPLAEVNRLLADAQSLKRIGVLYAGGNEGIAHLQPAQVWDVLRAMPVWGASGRPAVP